MNKKILYFVTRAICGGAQVHLLQLLRGLGPSFQCAIAVGAEGYLTTAARQLGADVFVMPEMVTALDPVSDWSAVRKARRVIDTYKPDIVHAHSSKAGIIGRIAARMAGVPALFTVHGWAFSGDRPLTGRVLSMPMEWMGARICQKIVTVCSTDRALCLKRHIAPASKVDLIYNGIADCSLRAQPGSSDRVTLGMVARFEEPKDQSSVIEALPKLPKETRLLLVGDGPARRRCEALASKLGVAGRVHFLGTCNNVQDILAKSNIFVLASHWESLPISILEAMRAGLPVVASDVGGVREAVVDGQTGFVIPRGDGAALQSKLSLLIGAPDLRAECGQRGRQRFLDMFTAERMLETVRELYQRSI